MSTVTDIKPARKTLVTFDIPVSDEEIAALIVLTNLHYGSSERPSDVVRMATVVLKLALAHPTEVRNWINEHALYREREGFEGTHEADDKLMLSRIRGRIEYAEFMPS